MAKNDLVQDIDKIVNLLGGLVKYNCDFWDENQFYTFYNQKINDKHFYWDMEESKDIQDNLDIIGYFDDPILDLAMKFRRAGGELRIITKPDAIKNSSEKKAPVIKKLEGIGVKIRYNSKVHARIINFYRAEKTKPDTITLGELIIGSFDFDKECMSRGRRDAGIHTMSINMVEDARKFFNKTWNDQIESKEIEIEKLLNKNKMAN